MKTTDKQPLFFVIIIWSIFLIWEYQIQTLGVPLNEDIRYDLMVLPLLLSITGYVIYAQLQNKK